MCHYRPSDIEATVSELEAFFVSSLPYAKHLIESETIFTTHSFSVFPYYVLINLYFYRGVKRHDLKCLRQVNGLFVAFPLIYSI